MRACIVEEKSRSNEWRFAVNYYHQILLKIYIIQSSDAITLWHSTFYDSREFSCAFFLLRQQDLIMNVNPCAFFYLFRVEYKTKLRLGIQLHIILNGFFFAKNHTLWQSSRFYLLQRFLCAGEMQ